MPYESITDYCYMLQVNGKLPSAAFWWPLINVHMNMFFEVALHELPPGKIITVKNAKPIPAELLCSDTLRGSTAPGVEDNVVAPTLGWHVADFYRDCPVSCVPSIIEGGFATTTGAGQDKLFCHYEREVSGVYVANEWWQASNYPMTQTSKTVAIAGQGKSKYPGGTYVAKDGTAPLRCVLRVLAKKSNRL